MRCIAASALAAALLASGTAFAESSLEGTWETVVQTPQGAMQATMTVAETEEGYAVTIEETPPLGPSEISDVVIEGDTFSFTRALSMAQGPMNLAYSGEVDGNELTGTVNSDFGPIPLSGARK